MELKQRKPNRLKNYDYGQNGQYFVTICVDEKLPITKILSKVEPVGNAVPGVPKKSQNHAVPGDAKIILSNYGIITEKIILRMKDFYDCIKIDKYVIMPNHIHLLITIDDSGAPGTVHPTLSQFIGTMKRMINKEIGVKIWQKSFHDHIIRDDNDYMVRWKYIDDNPAKWLLNEP